MIRFILLKLFQIIFPRGLNRYPQYIGTKPIKETEFKTSYVASYEFWCGCPSCMTEGVEQNKIKLVIRTSNNEIVDDSDSDEEDDDEKSTLLSSLKASLDDKIDDLDYDSHYNCWCKDDNADVCGCGCDDDHAGW